jgi:hypothetical protein
MRNDTSHGNGLPMNYDLTTPCKNCPFRSDVKPYIHAGRAEEILRSDGCFPCHKTVDYSSEDEDGFTRGKPTKKSQHCAGFLILLERDDTPNQMMRIAERLRLYDRNKLRMDAPVYESVEGCLAAHEEQSA